MCSAQVEICGPGSSFFFFSFSETFVWCRWIVCARRAVAPGEVPDVACCQLWKEKQKWNGGMRNEHKE